MTQISKQTVSDALSTLKVDAEIGSRVSTWLSSWAVSPDLLAELLELATNKDVSSLTDAFFQDLEFGTGGLRGIVGPGTNRMNEPGVSRAAQGIANYLVMAFPPEARRVVIAYDSRLYSRTFAEVCARVICANGIQCFIFDTYETTPALSFAVRQLSCPIGLCLTASHNPPAYAGLKVYAEDGAQVVPPVDKTVLEAVKSVQNASQIHILPLEDAYKQGLLKVVPQDVRDAYFQAVAKLQTHPGRERALKAVYTPLHGTGAAPARRVMAEWGFRHFDIVPSQEKPDGRFPTVRKPNPEEPEALGELISFAQEKDAQAGFATDPDSDRLALISKESDEILGAFSDQAVGNYVLLNGNQTGALFLSFILRDWKTSGRLPDCPTVVKTIVTSEMHTKICESFGVNIVSVLTGFKWIAALVRQWEESKSPQNYVFGTEESFGYMPGTYVRDKDGISAMAMCAEMVDSVLAEKKNTPCEELLSLFETFGAWREDLYTIDLEGKSGKEKIRLIMDSLRHDPPDSIAGHAITSIEDYSSGLLKKALGDGRFETLEMPNKLPPSDVLILRLDDGGQVSIRPSGTEPKIKFYFSAVRDPQPSAIAGYAAARAATRAYLAAAKEYVGTVLSQ